MLTSNIPGNAHTFFNRSGILYNPRGSSILFFNIDKVILAILVILLLKIKKAVILLLTNTSGLR